MLCVYVRNGIDSDRDNGKGIWLSGLAALKCSWCTYYIASNINPYVATLSHGPSWQEWSINLHINWLCKCCNCCPVVCEFRIRKRPVTSRLTTDDQWTDQRPVDWTCCWDGRRMRRFVRLQLQTRGGLCGKVGTAALWKCEITRILIQRLNQKNR